MPTLEISDATFKRLQTFATPLVDTNDTTLQRLFDLVEKGGATLHQSRPSVADGAMTPNLTHTAVTSAVLNGKALAPWLCNWNALMLHTIRQAALHMPKGLKIADLIVVNHVVGEKTDDGYKHIPEAGLSVQGQNANKAWKATRYLAEQVGFKVVVNFRWSEHPAAERPGQTAHLTV